MSAVLVVGPALAGTTSVVAALRARLSGQAVLEAGDWAAGDRPAAVVFVVSAAAPMTPAQARLLERHRGPVVATVSKVDVHRTWRAVLEANRALLPVTWVPVAAAPDVGPVRVDDLVSAVRSAIGTPPGFSLRPSRTGGPDLAARIRLQQCRIESSAAVRGTCAGLRAELQAAAAELSSVDLFARHARRRIARVTAELEAEVTRRLAAVTGGPVGWQEAPVLPGEPPLPPAGLESRLATVLGIVLGAGVALTLGRAVGDFLPRWTPVIASGCALIGLALGLWVVRTRRLLSERAAADRWVADITAGLRSALEDRVTARVLAAEAALLTSAPFVGRRPD
ncbi:MAG: hypothetical protein ACR2JI_08215 [Mycobacterium sp.]